MELYFIGQPKFKNITENSFEISIDGIYEGYEEPTSYDLHISGGMYSGEPSQDILGLTPSQFPYKYQSKITGQKYLVFIDAHYYNTDEVRGNVGEVTTRFVPIRSIRYKGRTEAKFYLPLEANNSYGYFNEDEIEITPANASNSNEVYKGSIRAFKRELSDSSVSEMDYYGNIIPKKRGVTYLKTSKADSRDLFSPITAKIEVYQNVESLTVEKDFLRIKLGNTEQINTSVLPKNANNQSLIFTSGSPQIVSVNRNSGVFKGESVGTATITVQSADVSSIRKYVTIEVVKDTENIFYDINSIGRYLNASDFNMLQNNLEYVYKIVKSRIPSTPTMNFPRVASTTDFFTVKKVIDGFFTNIYNLSRQGVSGFTPIRDIKAEYTRMEFAPNNKMWNDALESIKQMKGVLDNAK